MPSRKPAQASHSSGRSGTYTSLLCRLLLPADFDQPKPVPLQAIEKEEVVESAPATLCKEESDGKGSMRVRFEAAVRRAQDEICKAVSDLDGKEFHEDAWTRPGGGGGVSRVLQVNMLTSNVSGLHLVSSTHWPRNKQLMDVLLQRSTRVLA